MKPYLALIILISGFISCARPSISLDPKVELMPVHHSKSNGAFYGFVVDRMGIPIDGATVKMKSSDLERQTQTDKIGRFVFNDLRPGTYAIEASKAGFTSTRIKPNLEVRPNSACHMIFALSPESFIDDLS